MTEIDEINKFLTNECERDAIHHESGVHPLGGTFEQWIYKIPNKFEEIEVYVLNKDGKEIFDIMYTLRDYTLLHMESLHELEVFIKIWKTKGATDYMRFAPGY